MKTVEARISESLDSRIDALVEQGWFRSRGQVLEEAIRRPEVIEQFIRADVEWGLRGRK